MKICTQRLTTHWGLYLHTLKVMPTIRSIVFCLIACLQASMLLAQLGRVQFIHGSADPAVHRVDLWLDSVKIADDIAFREATTMVPVNATGNVRFYVTDSASVDTNNALLTHDDSLYVGEDHVMILQGLTDSLAGYSDFEPLQLQTIHGVPLASGSANETEVQWVHTSTDAGEVVISEERELLGDLVYDYAFAAHDQTSSFYPSIFRIRLERAQDGTGLTEAILDLIENDLSDSAVVALISGFAHPENNLGGPSLSVDLVMRDGTVIPLPRSTGRLQVIHNSPDPTLTAIDVYVEDELFVDNLAFRAATGFLSIPSGVPLEVATAADSASGALEALRIDTLIVEAGASMIALLSGCVDPDLSVIHPLMVSTRSARREALNAGQTDILFHNGGPDLELASVYESSILNQDLFSDRSFGQFGAYRSLPYSNYIVDLVDEVEGSIFATYDLDLTQFDLEGSAVTIVTSGWKDTNTIAGLPDLGLWMARSVSGKMIQLPLTVGIAEPTATAIRSYPNPAWDALHLRSKNALGEVRMHNTSGQLVFEGQFLTTFAHIDVRSFASGVYLMEVRHDDGIQRMRIVVQH